MVPVVIPSNGVKRDVARREDPSRILSWFKPPRTEEVEVVNVTCGRATGPHPDVRLFREAVGEEDKGSSRVLSRFLLVAALKSPLLTNQCVHKIASKQVVLL